MDIKEALKSIIDIDLYKSFDFKEFFNLTYLFEKSPTKAFAYIGHVYLISFILFLIGLYFFYVKTRKEYIANPEIRFLKFTGKLAYGLAVVGFLYGYFREQGVDTLSSRIVLLIWLILIIAYFLYIRFYSRRKLPAEIDNFWAKRTREKYLPRRKR